MEKVALNYFEFLWGFLSAPFAVSSPTPSGSILAARIAEKLDPNQPGLVVELGPGTGAITQALIDHGISAGRLVAIESTTYFASRLKERFPQATIHEADAFEFDRYLPPQGKVAAVVSGIPLLNFERRKRYALINKALRLCGNFVQISYSWIPPIAPSRDVILERTFVWRNLPPAYIWRFTTPMCADESRTKYAVPLLSSVAFGESNSGSDR